jgi:hypothetical protein
LHALEAMAAHTRDLDSLIEALRSERAREGRLLRMAWFGSCRRCGDVEGRVEPESEVVLCAACGHALGGARERAIVAVEEREVYVDPAELRHVDPMPYD